MSLIRNGQYTEDKWIALTEDMSLPKAGAVIVPLSRWADLREAALEHRGSIGVSIHPDDEIEMIFGDVAQLDLIVIEFPTFKDGRGFSAARLLRERHGFMGELRATGHVIYDQLQFLHRCGFDAVDLPPHLSVQDWREALGEISVFYQPTGDGRQDVVRLRHGIKQPIRSIQRFASAAE